LLIVWYTNALTAARLMGGGDWKWRTVPNDIGRSEPYLVWLLCT